MSRCPMHFLSRRGFFKSAGKGLGLMTMGAALGPKAILEAHATEAKASQGTGASEALPATLPFYGTFQQGILTPQQAHTYFATLDVVSEKKADLVHMFKQWTEAAARMTEGQSAGALSKDLTKPAKDTGEALNLKPARLTLTFGFGSTLFVKNGKDRFHIAKKKPAQLTDLPKFHGDQLVDEKSDGDLSIQACADDPQVAFHAVRQLARLAAGVAQIRWAQTGFVAPSSDGSTPRNLMGFKDGTAQPKPPEYNKFVWANADSPAWMRNGSYLVVRKIRIALEHWDRTEVDFQEEVIGRHKDSGAVLGQKNEMDQPDLNLADKDGNLVLPMTSHVRLATAASNDGAQILRRGYSYNDGVNFIAERWPPWTQGMEYDAGLFFVSYQSDPRSGFTKIFQNMSKLDALNQFTTHTQSGLFACPPGVKKGEYIGQTLFG